MSVDIKSICVGDYITIRVRAVEVDYDDPNRTIQVSYINSQGWVPNDDIVTHESRALAVGDIVRYKDGEIKFKIVCIDEGVAWLNTIDSTGRSHTLLSFLKRAE